MCRSWVGGLWKRGDKTIEVAGELQNDAEPALRPAPPEQALPAGLHVRFSVGGMFDGQHDVQQRVGYVGVLLPHMIPGVPGEFNRALV